MKVLLLFVGLKSTKIKSLPVSLPQVYANPSSVFVWPPLSDYNILQTRTLKWLNERFG